MKIQEFAIIVAGGKGTRMQTEIPKQFLMLKGIPVLCHTINAFFDYNPEIQVIVVLPAEDIETWKKLCGKLNYQPSVTITSGGETRFQSVKNGLACISAARGLVAIHDGVRPLIEPNIIGASFRIAAVHKSAVAAVRLKESLRITDQDQTKAVDRSYYRIIQTPQTFDLQMIKKAYIIREESSLTDDASVAEKAGHKISLFEGSYENIKITTPEDLVVAQALLESREKNS